MERVSKPKHECAPPPSHLYFRSSHIRYADLEDPLAAGSQDPSQAESTQSRRDPDELATVHVSLRTFLKFLGAHVVNGTTIAGAFSSAQVFGSVLMVGGWYRDLSGALCGALCLPW